MLPQKEVAKYSSCVPLSNKSRLWTSWNLEKLDAYAALRQSSLLEAVLSSRNDCLISHAVRVNPQFSNRMIEASRSVLNRYIPDIYLYSDVYKGDESGKLALFLNIDMRQIF